MQFYRTMCHVGNICTKVKRNVRTHNMYLVSMHKIPLDKRSIISFVSKEENCHVTHFEYTAIKNTVFNALLQ